MRPIIPDNATVYLPFSEQPYTQWEGKNDLDVLYFLFELHDKTDKVILPDGTHSEVNYRSYGAKVFEYGTQSIEGEAQLFASAARSHPTSRSVVKQQEELLCLEDARFGRAAKYLIAWEGIQGEVLSESAFFSIAHLLEADTDLKCSVGLAANLYYKQALQVLRSYVENIVLPLLFCADPQAYRLWKQNKFRTPNFRGPDGVLNTLVDEYILSPDLANEAASLYGDLNEAVHGSERSMIHSGMSHGHHTGHVFDDHKFGQWCHYVSRAVNLGILFTQINLYQWSLAKPLNNLACIICHNATNFTIFNESNNNGVQLTHFRCNACGNEFNVRKDSTDSKQIIRTNDNGTEVLIIRPE